MIDRGIAGTAVQASRADESKLQDRDRAAGCAALRALTKRIKLMCPPDTDPEKEFERVDHIVRSTVGWETTAPGMTEEERFMEFCANWQDTGWIPDQGILERCYQDAEHWGIYHLGFRNRWDLQDYLRFLSLLGHLQKEVGRCSIMLPVKRIAEIIGIQSGTVASYCRWADKDGFLEVAAPEVPGIRATKFRFDVNQFPELLN